MTGFVCEVAEGVSDGGVMGDGDLPVVQKERGKCLTGRRVYLCVCMLHGCMCVYMPLCVCVCAWWRRQELAVDIL